MRNCSEAEYGGYLPLELRHGKEYFDTADKDIRRYNCARTALYALAETNSFQQVYVPYYICDTVLEVLSAQEILVKRYHLNENFEPADIGRLPDDAALLIINYFGLLEDSVNRLQKSYKTVIIDQTQAFFSPPVLREGVSNIYSCRKFIGVPDGGYLIAKDCTAPQFESGTSWEAYAFLCKSHEEGTNAAYGASLENEQRLGQEKTGMSKLTRMVLKSTSYEDIKTRRRNNFTCLAEILGGQNRLKLRLDGQVPYLYPYWGPEGRGEWIRGELVKRHIYTPALCKGCLESCGPEHLEYQWAKDMICLPIDQRYGSEDMKYLADTLISLCE